MGTPADPTKNCPGTWEKANSGGQRNCVWLTMEPMSAPILVRRGTRNLELTEYHQLGDCAESYTHSSGSWKSELRVPVRLAGGPLVDLELLVSLVMAGMRELFGVSLTRALIPFPGALPSGPESFRRPHLLSSPSGGGGGFGFQHTNGSGKQTFRLFAFQANLPISQSPSL